MAVCYASTKEVKLKERKILKIPKNYSINLNNAIHKLPAGGVADKNSWNSFALHWWFLSFEVGS